MQNQKKRKIESQSETTAHNKEAVNFYYKLTGRIPNEWKCVCGNVRIQQVGAGYSNLMQHITSQHPSYLKEILEQKKYGKLEMYGLVPSARVSQIYGWLDFIISEGYMNLFSFLALLIN